MTTPFFCVSGPKEAKNGTLAKQTLGATDLIYGMYTQLDFGSSMGGILLLPLVCKKNFRVMLGPKESDEQTHFNVYVLVCKCLCLGITAKRLNQKAEIWYIQYILS